MKLTSATIVLSSFSLICIVATIWNLKRENLGIRSALVWALLWAAIGYFSLFPGSLDAAMRLAQMGNRMFFISMLAILVLFAFVFGLSSRLDKLDQKLTKLTREIGILAYKIDQAHRESEE
jgi:hypothetical protein